MALSPTLACARLRLDPTRIGFVKFILEGYDNLAILSTVDRETGLVQIRYPAELEADLFTLLRDVCHNENIAISTD